MKNLKNIDKNKIINIILIIVAVLVFSICLFLYITHETQEEDIVLVKDMTDSTGRIISDKSDGLKGKENLVIKAEKSEDMLNPDDVFKEVENPIDVKGNDKGRTDVVIIPKNEENPLDIVGQGEIVGVIREESIEPDKKNELDPILELLEQAKKDRNIGRSEISVSFGFMDIRGNLLSLEDINTKGVVVIPFVLKNTESLEYLKSLENLYDTYKNQIDFMFLNTSFDAMESSTSILNKFEELTILTTYPLYFDSTLDFTSSNRSNPGFGCLIVNSDSYLFKRVEKTTNIDTLESYIKEVISEVKASKQQDDTIRVTGIYRGLSE